MKPIINKFLSDNFISKNRYFELSSNREAATVIGNQEALYALYNNNNEILYIGWARYISQRLGQHFNNHPPTSSFYEKISYAKYTFNICELRAELDSNIKSKYDDIEVKDLEYFVINCFNPPYNKVKGKELSLKII